MTLSFGRLIAYVTRESDGKVLYENALTTSHELDEKTVHDSLSEVGRYHWKTENENHNVLKTKGYHLEHNFGHGQEHLAVSLLPLNLLAFLFHTVLHLSDEAYNCSLTDLIRILSAWLSKIFHSTIK